MAKNEIKKIAVVGASGYAGIEAVKIALKHQGMELTSVVSKNHNGQPLSKLLGPNAPGLTFCDIPSIDMDNTDVVLSCLPHCASAVRVKEWRSAGKVVIDLSADFRHSDAKTFEEWYDKEHPVPELLGEAVYGLPEVNRSKIKETDLIACPGCYPTATNLGFLPAMKASLVEAEVIVNAVSGVSGAGRQSNVEYSFCEMNENMYAYGGTAHRHTPEMEMIMSSASGLDVKVNFIPHLGSFNRGIHATIYGKLQKDISQEDILKLYKEFYKDEPFVTVCDENPKLVNVQNTNFCHIYPLVNERTGILMVFSVIDNLLKGASGQAVQCFNIRFGWEETTALLG